MAINYPLSLPTTTGLAQITFSARNTVGVSQSPFTMKQQVQKHQGQRWEAQVTLPPLSRAEAEEWISFLLKLNGTFGTFFMGDPAGAIARGAGASLSDTLLINGANQTGNTLNLDGATASTSNYARAGDYLQVGSQLFKVLSDADSNASGELSLDVWPDIRVSPSDNAGVIGQNTVAIFRLASNQTDFSINSAKIYGLSFAAIEAL